MVWTLLPSLPFDTFRLSQQHRQLDDFTLAHSIADALSTRMSLLLLTVNKYPTNPLYYAHCSHFVHVTHISLLQLISNALCYHRDFRSHIMLSKARNCLACHSYLRVV